MGSTRLNVPMAVSVVRLVEALVAVAPEATVFQAYVPPADERAAAVARSPER